MIIASVHENIIANSQRGQLQTASALAQKYTGCSKEKLRTIQMQLAPETNNLLYSISKLGRSFI